MRNTPSTTWFAKQLEAFGYRIFRACDSRARALGWEVTIGRSGLSRTYRDPRFDLLARCADCAGYGEIGDGPCSRCAGTGRVRLDVDEANSQLRGSTR